MQIQYSKVVRSSTFIHELKHVEQFVASGLGVCYPVKKEERKAALAEDIMSTELPAYYYGALAARARKQLGYEPTDSDKNNIDVDDTRQLYTQAADDFSPRGLLIRGKLLDRQYPV